MKLERIKGLVLKEAFLISSQKLFLMNDYKKYLVCTWMYGFLLAEIKGNPSDIALVFWWSFWFNFHKLQPIDFFRLSSNAFILTNRGQMVALWSGTFSWSMLGNTPVLFRPKWTASPSPLMWLLEVSLMYRKNVKHVLRNTVSVYKRQMHWGGGFKWMDQTFVFFISFVGIMLQKAKRFY